MMTAPDLDDVDVDALEAGEDIVPGKGQILMSRQISDVEIRSLMHSARPKAHETQPPDGLTSASVVSRRQSFVLSTGLTTGEADTLRQRWGRNVLEEKNKSKWKLLWEQFSAPMPIMIWVVIVVEAALQNWLDMGILLALQAINGFVGFFETVKAGNAVAALKASLKPTAQVKRDGKWSNIDSAELVPGDLVMLSSGAAVPADCVVNEGQIDVDQAALTGESLPVTMGVRAEPKMGSTVTRGESEATVQFTGQHTFFGKTASLIQSADGAQSHLQRVLLKIMVALLSLSLVLVGITLAYLLLAGEDFQDSLGFTVVVLVASIPVAMEVVVTATMALGSRQLASEGAIVARLASIEEMAGMSMLCSDKTGTLTMNKMVVQEDCPVFMDGVDRASVLLHAALAAKWREPPKDALDTMVLTSFDLSVCEEYEQVEYLPFDPAIKRTEAMLRRVGAAGPNAFKVTKGAPHIVLAMCANAAEIKPSVDRKVIELAERGIRSLAVARTPEGDSNTWNMMGIITFLDPPRPDTKETIRQAIALGVDVKMITGDHLVIAKETARQLGMGTNIRDVEGLPTLGEDGVIPPDIGKTLGPQAMAANGFAQVFPEHKFLIVEALRQQGLAVGMTGDGVNDAPALKKADVGIAVHGATDAARASADIVLTTPGLSIVITAIEVSRQIFARIKSFIIYRIAATLQLLVFFFLSVIFIHPSDFNASFPDFWSMPVVALIMITVLNDGTIISIAYDNVSPSKTPEQWNLGSIALISGVLAAVACGSSLLCLWMGLDSDNDGSLFARWGLPVLDYGEVVTMMYLKISLSDFLTVFASRSRTWAFAKAPGKLLVAAFVVAVGLSTILAITWPLAEGASKIDGQTVAFVWIYCLVWVVLQDAVKVATIRLMEKHNWFNYNHDVNHTNLYPSAHFDESASAENGEHHPHHFLSHFSRHRKLNERARALNPTLER